MYFSLACVFSCNFLKMLRIFGGHSVFHNSAFPKCMACITKYRASSILSYRHLKTFSSTSWIASSSSFSSWIWWIRYYKDNFPFLYGSFDFTKFFWMRDDFSFFHTVHCTNIFREITLANSGSYMKNLMFFKPEASNWAKKVEPVLHDATIMMLWGLPPRPRIFCLIFSWLNCAWKSNLSTADNSTLFSFIVRVPEMV